MVAIWRSETKKIRISAATEEDSTIGFHGDCVYNDESELGNKVDQNMCMYSDYNHEILS